MVVHELATNAAKYGAFSVPHGEVFVSWRLEGPPGEVRSVVVEWREAGGPLVKTPGHEGFGTSTIRDLLPFEQNGVVTLNFEPRGVICTIALPAACLAERKAPENTAPDAG
jgi:two-component system CheB/CheR fusion protein